MKIQESRENYLEAILALRQKQGNVRSIDVAQHLSVTKPSVSRAMALLRDGGYITTDSDGFLFLTPDGETLAERIYERHQLITRWLIALGVNPEVAAEDACRVEHAFSQESFDKIKAYIELHMEG